MHWSTLSKLSRVIKRENENSFDAPIVSAVSFTICFQEHLVYLLYRSSVVKCSLATFRVTILDLIFQTRHSKRFHKSKPSAPNCFPLTLEATGILEFALAAVDLPVEVACAVLFTGMPVLPATGIDERGFPNIFEHF